MQFSRTILVASAAALVLSPVVTSAALAQPSDGYQGDTPPPGYDNSPPPGYNGAPSPNYSNAPPQQGYYNSPPPQQQQGYNNAPQGYNGAPQGYAGDQQAYDQAPPSGYDGTRPPPPPPGYQPTPADLAQQQRDERYAYDAEMWARNNCVKSHSNAGAGAVIGGIFGAILGNGLSGRHDRGAGTLAGAAVGAVGGAAIGGSTGGQTSPGCPPGYVVRNGAPSYAYDTAYYSDYYYAAPDWYRPWVFVGGNWNYRPYPYHSYYYRTYRPYHAYGWGRGGRPGYYGGYGRGGYRRR
ncbi:MAG TPA: glycine zipper 2TM domain-containing protein [Sphingobium sp.]|uniref:glycine zipper 2TM domain-containing protein n=1 Tax=Sphingobium sp. TaxID=1912891 RepID=UPI002ED4C8FC